MICSPFPFLAPLQLNVSSVSCLSNIQLFCDTSQRLILAVGDFSLASYKRSDFADLKLDFPASIEGAVIKRQAEYQAGRFLSHLAMQQSGLFHPAPPLRILIYVNTHTGECEHPDIPALG